MLLEHSIYIEQIFARVLVPVLSGRVSHHRLGAVVFEVAVFASVAHNAQVVVQVPEDVEAADAAHDVLVAQAAFQVLQLAIGRVDHWHSADASVAILRMRMMEVGAGTAGSRRLP